jgi:succinoglycan biosynthesis transport protein ExoP
MLEERNIAWQEISEVLLRRWRLVLAVTLAGSLAAGLWVWLASPVFRAKATILLGAQRISGPRADAMPDKQIESEMALLSSPTLVRAVLEEDERPAADAAAGGPGTGPTGSGKPAGRAAVAGGAASNSLYRRYHGMHAPDALDARVREVAKGIDTNRIEDSNVVEVAYRGTDPEWAATFVNRLLAKHVERIAHLNEQSNTPALFQQQRDLASQRLAAATEALNKFRARQGPDFSEGDEADLRKSLTELEAERAAATTALAEARARVDYLNRDLARHPETITSESELRQNESVRMLEARLLQLEMQRSEQITKYTPTSVVIKDLDKQIGETKNLLTGQQAETRAGGKTTVNPTRQTMEIDLVQKKAEVAALAARLGGLSQRQATLRAELGRYTQASPELGHLKSEEKSAGDAYLDYQKKAEEARLGRALDQSGIVNISILERALPPDMPEPAKGGLKMLVAFLASLALGIALALLRDRLDPAVTSDLQAERMTGVPVIERVPV